MKKRIWELDAFRGLCVLGMVLCHLIYDLVEMYRLISWEYPRWFMFVRDWGGVLFLLLSGVCATLGSRGFRRGLIVLGCGTLVSAVTWGMYLLKFAGPGIVIRFGVLQCLGLCMILWTACKRLPTWVLAVLGAVFVAAGLYLYNVILVDFPWLVFLGFLYPGFYSADYFPLLPHFGFFLLGAVLGRTVYSKKETLFPRADPGNPLIRTFTLIGKWSLPIYMTHQAVLAGLVGLIAYIVNS